MNNPIMFWQRKCFMILIAVLAIFASVAVFAGTSPQQTGLQDESGLSYGGYVFPPTAEPKGYSLYKMAKTIAYFNTGDHSGTPPMVPFQILYTSPNNPNNTFDVKSNTILYVPIMSNDDSPLVVNGNEYLLGDFPPVGNRNALLYYFYSPNELGFQYTEIVVDGKIISLGSDYLVEVKVPILADCSIPDNQQLCGTTYGTQYQTVAAFLQPLKAGPHTVEISVYANGDAFKAQVWEPYFPGGYWASSLIYKVNVY